MKKILLTIVGMFAMNMSSFALSTTTVLLYHGESVTTYAAEDIAQAMDASVDGDVIVLNEGSYPGFDITKKITVKGAGEKTLITGVVNIDISGVPTLTANLLEYMTFQKEVNVKAAITGMKVVQCYCQTNFFLLANVYDSLIDRCFLQRLVVNYNYDNSSAKPLSVRNSIVRTYSGADSNLRGSSSQNVSFVNCIFYSAMDSMGSVINCILNKAAATSVYGSISATVFVNSYIQNNGTISINTTTCTETACYHGDAELKYDSDDISANSYYGNDNTIIGPLGGSTPYTLVPSVPHVTDASLKVDLKKQELNATLTVSPN